MKVTSSLIIALLAIFSVFASATIVPIALNMVGNAGQLSIATSEFQSVGNNDEGGRTGQVAFFFPGQFTTATTAYKNLDCITAISINDASKSSVKRFKVSRSNESAGYTRINHDLSFDSGDVAGRFKTACSFIAPHTVRNTGVKAHASVAIGARTAIITDYNTKIYPSNSVIEVFEAYISPLYGRGDGSKFKFNNIDDIKASSKQFIIRNPGGSEATTVSTMKFETQMKKIGCDVVWDESFRIKLAAAEIIEDGNGVLITLTEPLKYGKNVVVTCEQLRGVVVESGFGDDTAKFFPTALEFKYDTYKTFSVAYTPSYPSPVSFETGFTPTMHVDPMSTMSE